MARTISVVVPVLNGARYLGEVCEAVLAQHPHELLVIDSGSTDGSQAIARAAGATVLEIAPPDFGHGRTRNLGAERTTGELICFLTQDATPLPGWLDAFRDAFDLDARVGAAYGPHRAREDTSPMIARELEAFFATHTPDGGPVVQRAGDEPYLSNVNACYARACWDEIRFPDVRYAEDQAFARAMLAAGWTKVFHPAAAVLHAHDYPPARFMQRYFDEYRGLRETIGHIERIGVRSTLSFVRGMVAADRRWMRERGMPRAERARWTVRATVHHGGRKVFSALGSRAHAMPAPVQRALSLEGTVGAADPGPPGDERTGQTRGTPIGAGRPSHYDAILRVARDGPAPLADPYPGMADREQLHLAVVIPPFRRGSGGHNSIFQMLSRLEAAGHTVTIWLHDPEGWQASEWPAVVGENIREFFAPLHAPVFKGFDDWLGADVVVATGWQTVHPAMLLEGARARVYLVHDHESEFYATSAQSLWAEQTYSLGLHAICASPWLAKLASERYGASTSLFDFGVDHAIYAPKPVARRRDTIVFYGREVTPRRAVPLGVLALAELRRRRPDLRVVIFGDLQPIPAPFPHEHLGIRSPEQLAWTYSEATVGLCLSLTNYSLIPQEMLACGLPCVDLAGISAESVFGPDGPVELSAADPVELADAMERLLDDEALWERRSQAGVEFVADRTWDRAAEQVEAGIREALRLRQQEIGRLHDPEQALERIAPAAAPPPGTDVNARAVPVAEPRRRPASDELFARLADEDVSALEEMLSVEERQLAEPVPGRRHPPHLLALGVHHRVPAFLERTGLVPDEPPDGVHAMGRGALAAGGAYYEADLVAEAVEAAGVELAGLRRALDFGCSSGRVARVLAAAWPDVEWHGSDPNAGAIAWASEHLPGVRFAVAPTDPPLPFADGAFDLAFAISIWSHFDEEPARAWLQEMHRVVQPGGLLVLTVHSYQSIAHAAQHAERPPRQLEQIRRALYRRGFWFEPTFGQEGDHGVRHPGWGTAYLTPEWLLRAVRGAWDVTAWEVGRNLESQDVVTLRRKT